MDAVDDTSSRLTNGDIKPSGLEDPPSLLTVIIDAHPAQWASNPRLHDIKEALSAILVLLNAHLALKNANQVAVISYDGRGPKFIWPGKSPKFHRRLQGEMYKKFQEIDEAVYNSLIEGFQAGASANTTPVSAPLSMALCYTDRITREVPGLRGRIFIFSVSEDVSSYYIQTMNCIFAAQKSRVPIDICNFAGPTSFLQQAADFTEGIYMHVENTDGLVQYFMSAFAIDSSLREFVNVPTQSEVEFNAVCFTTKKVISIGYVCSVCLCTMDKPYNECPLCGTPTEHKIEQ